jgi:hypothetical protein
MRTRHNQRYYRKKILIRNQKQQELQSKVTSGELTSTEARIELRQYLYFRRLLNA